LKLKETLPQAVLNEHLAEHTGQPPERIELDTERDFFMSPDESKDYGLTDRLTVTLLVADQWRLFAKPKQRLNAQ